MYVLYIIYVWFAMYCPRWSNHFYMIFIVYLLLVCDTHPHVVPKKVYHVTSAYFDTHKVGAEYGLCTYYSATNNGIE